MFRTDEIKTYLRNELKLTYHYILSYIYISKNIYKTDLYDWNNWNGTELK